MKKTISGIMCGIIAAGLLAGCANVSESNPPEEKATQAKAKPDQAVLHKKMYEAIKNKDLESVKKQVAQGADINYTGAWGRNALHYAAAYHSLEIFQWLVDHGADIHAVDKDGNTVLHLIFEWGTGYFDYEISPEPEIVPEMVKYLVARKMDLNAKNRHGDTPVRLAVGLRYMKSLKYLMEHGGVSGALKWVANEGNYEMVKCLVEHGADVNEKDNSGLTPLMRASSLPVAQYLVEHGAEINARDNDGQTPLFWHAMRDDLETVKYLIKSGADLKCRDKDGNSVILAAALYGALQNVKYFHLLGLDINDRNNSGETLLHNACRRDDSMEMIQYLVKHGSDVNAHCSLKEGSRTPLHYVIMNENVDAGTYLAYLLKNRANANEKDSKGMTALHYACGKEDLKKRLEIIKLLVSYNADINEGDLMGIPPWYYAVRNFECLKYLMEHGANIKKLNKSSITPLHIFAVLKGSDSKVVTYLLEHHFEINRQDDEGETPLHYAVTDLKTVKCLVEHGANVNLRDKEGNTPLDLVEEPKKDEIAKYLKAHGAVSGKSLNDNNKQRAGGI